MEKLKNTLTSERLALFIGNWSKITSNPLILDILKGYIKYQLWSRNLFKYHLLHHFHCLRGDNVSRSRHIGVVKEGYNKTEHSITKLIFEFNFSSSHERCRSLSNNKVKMVKSAHSVCVFQNRGIVPSEKAFTEMGLHLQNQPPKCII